MVTFKPVGRMGNFLFEAASAMAYALSHKQEFTIPNATNDEYWNPIYLLHLANPRYNPDLPEVVVTEKEFPFHKRPFDPAWEKYYPGGYNIRLDGYYQTEKYFRGFRAHILKTFNFPWIMVPGVVSVHVRRGDYLTIKKVVAGREMLKHPPVPKQWIEAQMAKFPNTSLLSSPMILLGARKNSARVLIVCLIGQRKIFRQPGLSRTSSR
jgi:hypothetical protein